MSSVALKKGVEEPWTIERVVRFIDLLGYREITLKSDIYIVISKNNGEQVGVVFDRIMAPSEAEVIVDQVSNLSAVKETVLFLGLLFLQTDSSFEMGIMDDFVQY